MTQELFNRLPGLLTRAQFKDVTGLSDEDMDARTITCNGLSDKEMDKLRAQELIPVWRPHANGSAQSAGAEKDKAARSLPGGKYYKRDAAKMGSFKL